MSDFYARKDPLSQYQPLSAVFAPLRTGAGIEKAPPTGLYSNVAGVSTDLSDIYDQGLAETDLIRFNTGFKSKGYSRVNNISRPDLQLVFRSIDVSPTPTPSTGVTPTPTQTVTPTQTPTPTITPSPTRAPGTSQPATPTPTKSPVTGTVSGGIAISVLGENLRRGTGTISPINITASYNTNIFKIIVEERSGANSAAEGTWNVVTTDTSGGSTVSFSTSFGAAFVGYYQFRATAYNNANVQIGQAITGSVQVIPNDISINLTASVVGTTITLTSNAGSNYGLIEHTIQQYDAATGGWNTLQTGTTNSLQKVLTSVATGSYQFRSLATASQLKEGSMYTYASANASVGTSVSLNLSTSPAVSEAGTIIAQPSVVGNFTTHTIVATPGATTDFRHFIIDGVVVPNSGQPTGGTTVLSMNGQSHTVVAVFDLKNVAFAIIPNPSNGGTASADLVSPVAINSIINLSNSPQPNYHFKNYTVNGIPIGSSYQLTGNTTIFSNFEPNSGVYIRVECLNQGVAPYTIRTFYANGTGGEYYVDSNNSVLCGYVAPPTNGTLLSTYCSGDPGGNPEVPGVNKWGVYANGSGGTYNALTLNGLNSPECGYVAPPVSGTILRNVCSGVKNAESVYHVRADGSGGEYTDATPFSVFPDANAYCFYEPEIVVGERCQVETFDGNQFPTYNLYNVVADGKGGTKLGGIKEYNSVKCGYIPANNPIGPPETNPNVTEA